MSTKEIGGPAFPFTGHFEGEYGTADGMTLRDYFAAKVMQGLVTGKDGWSDEWAGIAYKIADTMLEARK